MVAANDSVMEPDERIRRMVGGSVLSDRILAIVPAMLLGA